MILNLLNKSKTEKLLISLNLYGSDNGFYLGYVVDFSEEIVIIQHYNKFGLEDGLLTLNIADVKYFEIDTEYLKDIQFLISSKNRIQHQTLSVNDSDLAAESLTTLFEEFIGNKNYLIRFELMDEETYYGFLEWCDEDNFEILDIDSDGKIRGKLIFKFEDIKLYWLDDLDCRKRQILYKEKISTKI